MTVLKKIRLFMIQVGEPLETSMFHISYKLA